LSSIVHLYTSNKLEKGEKVLADEIITYLQNLTEQRITQKDLGDALGISKQAIGNKKADNYHFKEYEIEKIKRYILDKYKSTECTIIDKDEPQIILDYYPEVFGSCGTGVFELSQTKEQLIVPKKAFFTRYSTNKKYSVINARGNSMQPYIYDGDRLIVEHWEGEQIIDNRPYVFCYDNEIFIKRLAKNVNQLIISSDNHDYNKIVLQNDDLNKVQVIGQIVGLMRDLR